MKNRYGTRKLSPTQIRVAKLLGDGLRNREIANLLHIGEQTVKGYNQIIFDKLGLDTRLEVALWYHEHQHELPTAGLKPDTTTEETHV